LPFFFVVVADFEGEETSLESFQQLLVWIERRRNQLRRRRREEKRRGEEELFFKFL